MSGQPLQCPGEAGRGRVVPGDEQGHQLIAQFAVGHGVAVVVARADQHREGVSARRKVGIGSPVGDFGVQQTVGFLVLRRSERHGPSRCRLGFAIASDAHGVTLSSFGITSRSAASRSGSEAPMTVRRITSRVISDIFGATANSDATGHVAMFAAAISAITAVCRATASRWNGGQHLAPPLPMHVVVDHQHRTVAE